LQNFTINSDLTFFSWGNEIVADDEEERSIVVAAMASSAYVVGIWLILIIWKQVDGPRYHKGFITASCFSVAAVITTLLVRELAKRERRR
jgi:ACS family pantothenate transporter-like MFS transporter